MSVIKLNQKERVNRESLLFIKQSDSAIYPPQLRPTFSLHAISVTKLKITSNINLVDKIL